MRHLKLILAHWLGLASLTWWCACPEPLHAALSGKLSLITQRESTLISTGASGLSGGAQLSPDGKLLFFSSSADGLIPNDLNVGAPDLFWTDLASGMTSKIAPNSQNLVYASEAHLVAFDTTESLVPEDTNGLLDVYVKDLLSGQIELISVSTNGAAGSADSWDAAISRDGRFVVFESKASNIVRSLPYSGLYLRDRQAGRTVLISTPVAGVASVVTSPVFDDMAVSGNDKFVIFSSTQGTLVKNDGKSASDVFVYDIEAATNELVSVSFGGTAATGDSVSPQITQDGRYALFLSSAKDILTNSPSLGQSLYLRDRSSGSTRLISSNVTDFAATPDAAYTAFAASNLVYRFDRASGEIRVVSSTPDGSKASGISDSPSISDDGQIIAFTSNATNLLSVTGDAFRVYVRDLRNNSINLPGLPAAQTPGVDALFPTLSADGSTLAFQAFDAGLTLGDLNRTTDLFISRSPWLNVQRVPVPATTSASAGGQTQLASRPFTADGRYVLFWGASSDLLALDQNGFYDIYLHDSRTRRNELISINSSGAGPGNNSSSQPVISADGRFVAFTSTATNLVAAADLNNAEDIFVRDRQLGQTFLVSVATAATNTAKGQSINPSISADGRFVAFESTATDLSAITTSSGIPNVYVRDLLEGQTTLVSKSATRAAPSNGRSTSPLISPNGGYLAFYSTASDLTTIPVVAGLYVRDLQTLETRALGTMDPDNKIFSEDSSTLLFTLSSAGTARLYYLDIKNGLGAEVVDTNVVSMDSISANGMLIGYTKYTSTNGQTDAWLFNRSDRSFTLISANTNGLPGNGSSSYATINPRGDLVAFKSSATDLVSGTTDSTTAQVYLRIRAAGETILVSKSLSGRPSNGQSARPRFSPNGQSIAFTSAASDLVSSDLNGGPDLFLFTLDSVDADADGLPDDWEMAYFGNLAAGPKDDPDGDGMSNLAEFRAGTNPNLRASVLQVLGVEVLSNGQRKVSWQSIAGLVYAVEYKKDLRDAQWTPILGEVQAAGAVASKLDSDATQPRRFYRLRVVE